MRTLLRRPTTSGRGRALFLVLGSCTAGCGAPASSNPQLDIEREAAVERGRREVGVRAPTSAPIVVLEGVCALPDTCSAYDINADGRTDLVRRTDDGVLEVALSNAWSFGSFRGFAQCGPDEECTLTNLDDDPGPEFVRLNPQLGTITVESYLVSGALADAFVTSSPSVCATGGSSCRLADLDGDEIAELTWIDDAGNLRFSAVGEEGNTKALSRGCRE